jgi:hypothetical protein
MSIGTKFPGKTALHQVYFLPNLQIALFIESIIDKMQDILEESWAYQDIMGKGVRQGVLAMQQTAISIVRRCCADLEELARTKITAIDDLERLQQLILDLTIAHTREQMERVLLSLGV